MEESKKKVKKDFFESHGKQHGGRAGKWIIPLMAQHNV